MKLHGTACTATQLTEVVSALARATPGALDFLANQARPMSVQDVLRLFEGNTARLSESLAGMFELLAADYGTASKATSTIIRIDRTIRPAYPDFVKDVLHPELELSGPAEFDLAKVEQWLHEGQKSGGVVRGEKIYEHLKEHNMLESCANLADLLAIQAKGVKTFRKHFAGKAVFAWKSVLRDRGGRLNVPCLFEGGQRVKLALLWLGSDWGGDGPAFRFAS